MQLNKQLPLLLPRLFEFEVGFAVAGLGVAAFAVEVQGVAADLEIVQALDQALDFEDARVTEFHDGAAFVADDVVVLPVSVGPLVVGLVLAELVPLHESAFDQQVEGVVHRSPRNPVAGILHFEKHVVGIEVSLAFVHLFEHHEALGGLPVTVGFEVLPEDFFDLVDGFL